MDIKKFFSDHTALRFKCSTNLTYLFYIVCIKCSSQWQWLCHVTRAGTPDQWDPGFNLGSCNLRRKKYLRLTFEKTKIKKKPDCDAF